MKGTIIPKVGLFFREETARHDETYSSKIF
jgi:hypothetical protein